MLHQHLFWQHSLSFSKSHTYCSDAALASPTPGRQDSALNAHQADAIHQVTNRRPLQRSNSIKFTKQKRHHAQGAAMASCFKGSDGSTLATIAAWGSFDGSTFRKLLYAASKRHLDCLPGHHITICRSLDDDLEQLFAQLVLHGCHQFASHVLCFAPAVTTEAVAWIR